MQIKYKIKMKVHIATFKILKIISVLTLSLKSRLASFYGMYHNKELIYLE